MTDSYDFAGLNPDRILEAIDGVGLRTDGRLLALNSYENRVYQVGIEESTPIVAKFYRPNRWSNAAILEEHALVNAMAESEIPAVPPLRIEGSSLFEHEGFRFSLFARRGGRPPELDQPGVLEWMGRFIGRMHAIGAQQAYQARPTLDAAHFGMASVKFLLSENFLPTELRVPYQAATEMALEAIAGCYEEAGDITYIRLHGDCHMGNVLWTDDGPHFVDFDDSRMGPAIQDLWMMLSGTPDEMQQQMHALLRGYEDFFEFNESEARLIEALRTLRLMHYAAWLARRWQDPAFPHNFPWFNTQQYWQNHILQLREQIALMSEPPLLGGGGNF